jgi:hypothetical protein
MNDATNGYDRTMLEGFLREIDHADMELASLKGEYMQSCKQPRADIAAVMERAKDAGIPVRVFKAIVKNRRLDREMHANVERLDLDQRAEYDVIVERLGDFVDLPLGQAALRRARPPTDEVLDSFERGDEGELSQVGRG